MDILISIHPHFADSILRGEKTVELRRSFRREVSETDRLFIYSTKPVASIVGIAEIRDIDRDNADNIWAKYGPLARISRNYFLDYVGDLPLVSAICLAKTEIFENRIPAYTLKNNLSMVPPQSYRYLTPDESAWIINAGKQNSHRYEYSISA